MLIPRTAAGDIDWPTLTTKYPCISAMGTCPQEPEHHKEGDVLTHTRLVAEAGENLSKSYVLSPEEEDELLFACIFHDIGKPITLTQGEDGKWSSPKHAAKGTEFLRNLLWETNSKIPLARREKLLALVRLHAWPVRFAERSHPEDTIIRASLQTSNKLLGLLAMADMTGRVCEDKVKQNLALQTAEYFLEYAKELNCLDQPFPFENARSKMHYLNKNGTSHPKTKLYEETTFEVTMLCGMPCSGKDHWLKTYPHPVISRDEIRRELKYPNEGEVLQELTARIKKALAKKEPFAINATNLRRELRGSFTKLVDAYKGSTTMVYLQTSKEETFRRLKAREKDAPSKEHIPQSAILKMAERCEPPTELECQNLKLVDTTPKAPQKKKSEPEMEM